MRVRLAYGRSGLDVELEQTADISATVAEALAAAGRGARACVLPEGPQTIPYLAPAGSAPGHQEAKMRAWPPEPCS